jgi:multisubunit Na+/H+ antiporter MnhB subunit
VRDSARVLVTNGGMVLRLSAVLYRLLADVVVAVHLAYLVFIPVGGFLAWRWRRLIPIHLAAVAVGLVSITVGFDCPLTTWEQSLRRRAGQHPYGGGFVDHYLTGKVYPHGYDTVVQVLVAVAVATAYAVTVTRLRGVNRW